MSGKFVDMEIDFYELAGRLSGALDLAQAPVAMCFSESIPEGVEAFRGRVPAGCAFWEQAASGWFATSAADHGLCAIGVYTHQLEASPPQQADLMDALKVFADLGYVREEDLGLIPVLERQPKFVAYGPLGEAPLAPDVVLLFVKPSEALILSEAAEQVEKGYPPAMGRPACAIIPQVMNTGRAGLSFGCCGARAYLDVLGESVAIFAIPGAKLAVYVERIEALRGANATLAKFHEIRRRDVLGGGSPTIKESLAALSAV